MIHYIHHKQLKVPSLKSLTASIRLSAFSYRLIASCTKLLANGYQLQLKRPEGARDG